MSLPIDSVLPELIKALDQFPCVILSAAPGAGKTTCAPLALLESGLFKGRIIMLEPRRLAAIRSAQYMARQLGEKAGETVGYRIRGEQRISARTRIEVVTEGILSRLLQADPALTGVDLLIFDEFHERSLHADLGLALARNAQQLLRDDLKILVMSATLDGIAISQMLDNAPVIESTGRQFPVAVFYAPADSRLPLEAQVTQLIQRATKEQRGDILVFLPGQGEIRRTQQRLEKSLLDENVIIHILLGESSPSQQQVALTPDTRGRRKIILSTSIAETSLTIDGVSVVVDAGLIRTARFDPRRGMAGLVTLPVSQATAEQRRGRAGRQRPGACYRLWSESQHSRLARYPLPEIVQSDLMPLALELAQWGTPEQQMCFLDPPPVALLTQAREVLQKLGALDRDNKITHHGRAMAQLPVHPRIAHMLIRANKYGLGKIACDVAALLEERDLLHGSSVSKRDVDFYSRWRTLKYGGGSPSIRERVCTQILRLQKLLDIHGDQKADSHENKLGLMLGLCYPEHIARRRDERSERWQMANGTGAILPTSNAFIHSEWIAVADVDSEGRDARIYLAAELDVHDLKHFFPEWFVDGNEVFWSDREEAVIARYVQRFGAIVISEQLLSQKNLSANDSTKLSEQITQCLCKGLYTLGWQALPLDNACRQWLLRVQWLQQQNLLPKDFPDFSEQALMTKLEQWLMPFVQGISRRAQLSQVRWLDALSSRLSWQQQQQIDQLAPPHITTPTGSRVSIDYSGPQPVLAVRLQEMFGERETPHIANGRVPLLLHLLSPKRSPLAVTQDLSSFWQNAYKDVCKDMRGQYSKHYWPDNPLEAEPTRRTKAADDRAARKK